MNRLLFNVKLICLKHQRSDFSFTSLTFFAFACEFSGIHKTEWGEGGGGNLKDRKIKDKKLPCRPK